MKKKTICAILAIGLLFTAPAIMAKEPPPNLGGEWTLTELKKAIFWGKTDELRMLIEAGVDVKSKFDTDPGKRMTPLVFACWFGIGESADRAEIVKVLIDAGANINKKYRGMSLLHVASRSQSKNKAVIELLIANGFHVNEIFDGLTPLHAAASKGRVGAAEALIENGAGMNLRISGNPYAPLHMAVLHHEKEMAELLLVKGANVNLMTLQKNGETPLDIAIRQGSTGLYDLLRKYGAIDKRIGDGSSVGAISNVEREALIAIYESTNGDNWTYKSNWIGPPGTEHIWYGVICDSGKNHVERLTLVNNNLVGQIPPELGNLTELIWLNFEGNQLSGSIPPELGRLKNLGNLNLSRNQLSGSIPPELGRLENLGRLNVSGNQLSGSIPP